MKQKRLLPLLAAVATMASCVDNNYDLSEIDKTVSSDVNLTLPSSSTGEIVLKNIMNLKDDGVVQVVTSPIAGEEDIFVVKQDGKADADPISINQIRVAKPTIAPFQATVDLREMLSSSSAPAKQATGRRNLRITIPVMGIPQDVEIEDRTFHYDIQSGQAKQDLEGATATNISADVLAIERISFNDVKVTLALNISGFPEYITKMHLDNLKLKYPSDLKIKSCTLNDVSCTIGEGEIQLTPAEDKGRDCRAEQRLVLVINEAVVGNEGLNAEGHQFTFNAQKHTATLGGQFDVTGTFRIETSEMNSAQMTTIIQNAAASWDAQKIAQFMATKDLMMVDGLIPATLDFRGKASFDRDIAITHVTGRFQHAVSNIKPIKLNNLPHFLNDEDVVLDIDNPMIVLRIKCMPSKGSNTTQTDFSTRITLKSDSKYADKNGYSATINARIGEEKVIVLSNNERYDYLPSEYKAAEKLPIPNLANLIKEIPKEVKVEVDPVQMTAADFDVTDKYDLDINYNVYAPLTFGPDFKLVYTGTERELKLDDVEELDFESIIVTAKATSSLPAKLNCTVVPIDASGNEISALEELKVDIPANAQNHAVRLVLKPRSGKTIHDLLNGKNGIKKMDGIQYRAVIDQPSANQKPLPAKASLKFTDVKVTLKGKVTYDAN